MKVQQIALYQSLKDFMVAVGYANAGDQRSDDPVWSTRNQNDFKNMMEYKFGVDSRFSNDVPISLDTVHADVLAHEAWVYRVDLEFNEGEDAPTSETLVAETLVSVDENSNLANSTPMDDTGTPTDAQDAGQNQVPSDGVTLVDAAIDSASDTAPEPEDFVVTEAPAEPEASVVIDQPAAAADDVPPAPEEAKEDETTDAEEVNKEDSPVNPDEAPAQE